MLEFVDEFAKRSLWVYCNIKHQLCVKAVFEFKKWVNCVQT